MPMPSSDSPSTSPGGEQDGGQYEYDALSPPDGYFGASCQPPNVWVQHPPLLASHPLDTRLSPTPCRAAYHSHTSSSKSSSSSSYNTASSPHLPSVEPPPAYTPSSSLPYGTSRLPTGPDPFSRGDNTFARGIHTMGSPDELRALLPRQPESMRDRRHDEYHATGSAWGNRMPPLLNRTLGRMIMAGVMLLVVAAGFFRSLPQSWVHQVSLGWFSPTSPYVLCCRLFVSGGLSTPSALDEPRVHMLYYDDPSGLPQKKTPLATSFAL